MRLLIVDSLFSDFGGGQKIAYDTYKILKNKGHEVFYWGMDKKPYFEEDYEYSKYFTPLYCGTKDYIKNPIKYYHNYRARHDLEKFVNYIQPDLIHYHSFWGLSSAIFNINKQIPKVLTIHDTRCCPATTLMFKDQYLCKEQYCRNGNYLPCIINKCVNNSFEASVRRSLLLKINNRDFRYIDKFITPSEALREKILIANIGIKENKISTIHNFLNNEEGMIEPNYDNEKYFLFVGRVSKEKGISYLLEAMNDLSREIKLKIVGVGPEENKLKQYVKDNKLDNVQFLGFKNRNEIKDIYSNCIATIVPSNWFEVFGVINIEAFINGKPVIASNVGGIPEIVENNINGQLFEPANVEQLKSCILNYWNNPNLVIEHGKNGYLKAKKEFNEDTYYTKLIKVYEEVLRGYMGNV